MKFLKEQPHNKHQNHTGMCMGLFMVVGVFAVFTLFFPHMTSAFTISGTLYSDQGQSAITTTKNLVIAVGTSTPSVQATSTDSGAGTFTVDITETNLLPTTTITIFVNGETEKAATVLKLASTTANISGVDLYQDHAILRHESGAPTTTFVWTGDFDFYDNSDDSDIPYTADGTSSSSALSVESNTTLYIWNDSQYIAGGGVLVNANGSSTSQIDGRLQLAGGASYVGGPDDLELGGSLIMASTSSFFPHATGTYFTATTTGKIVGPLYGDGEFVNSSIGSLFFAGVGGVWTLSGATSSNITIATGTVSHSDTVALTGDINLTTGTYESSSGTLMVGPGAGWTFTPTSTNITYTGNATTTTSGASGIADVFFKPDGTKMFRVSNLGNRINAYDLSEPWNVTTAVDNDESHYVGSETNAPRGLFFRPDGKRLFLVAETSGRPIFTYVLSTAWDLSDVYLLQSYQPFSSGFQGTDIHFRPDGLQFYMQDRVGNDVEVFDLSEPWNISDLTVTASTTVINNHSGQTGGNYIFFSIDGEVMYLQDNNNDEVFTYTLSIPWDVTTAVQDLESEYMIDPVLSDRISGIYISPDGTNMYLTGSSTIYQYDIVQQSQTFTGDFTGTSAFYDLTLANTGSNGTTSQSVIFTSAFTVDNDFTMRASTSAQLLAGATTTVANLRLEGSSGSPVWLRSSDTGTQAGFDVAGSQYTVTFVDVRDNYASSSVNAYDSFDTGNNTNWNFLAGQTGSSTISDHDMTQVNNAFDYQNKTNEPFFAFNLTPNSGASTVSNITITLTGIQNILSSDFSNIRLYRDHDNDALYDAADEQVGGAGAMNITGQNGSIIFSESFSATTSQNFLIIADWNAPEQGSSLTLSLAASNISVSDDVFGTSTVFGTVDSIQHNRNNKGGGSGSSAVIGTAPPPGDGDVGGGTNEGGELIGNDPDFFWPTANSGSWNGAENAYDQVDGTYASASTAVANEFTDYNDTVPGGDDIEGIEVKLEISGTTAAGDIDVDLSWDGGTSWTSVKTTPTLTTTDAVVTLGSPADTWGRTWSPGDFTNSNFALRVTANPSSNVIQIDGIQVKIYHQASGGGGGGGGAI